MNNKNYYAIYDSNDHLVFVGDAIESSRFMGIKKQSLYSLVGKTESGMISGKRYRAFRIVEEDCECVYEKKM